MTRFEGLRSGHAALAAKAELRLTIRHTRIAHVNAALSEKDVFGPLQITWNEVRDRVYEAAEFVGALAGARHPGEVGIPRDGRVTEATLKLLGELHKREAD